MIADEQLRIVRRAVEKPGYTGPRLCEKPKSATN